MTILEIIDSSVKIGIGALISGITTYLVTTKNHKHEKNHGLVLYKREKLVEISEIIDKSGELTNEITSSINNKTLAGGPPKDLELNDELRYAKEICNLISSAVSKSYLINDNELTKLLNEYWKNRNSFYLNFLNNKDDNWTNYDELKEEADKYKLNIYNQFSKSLVRIHS